MKRGFFIIMVAFLPVWAVGQVIQVGAYARQANWPSNRSVLMEGLKAGNVPAPIAGIAPARLLTKDGERLAYWVVIKSAKNFSLAQVQYEFSSPDGLLKAEGNLASASYGPAFQGRTATGSAVTTGNSSQMVRELYIVGLSLTYGDNLTLSQVEERIRPLAPFSLTGRFEVRFSNGSRSANKATVAFSESPPPQIPPIRLLIQHRNKGVELLVPDNVGPFTLEAKTSWGGGNWVPVSPSKIRGPIGGFYLFAPEDLSQSFFRARKGS